MSNFRQNAGQIGPINRRTVQFLPAANPWVHRQLVSVAGSIKPAPATATIAGQKKACCSECANQHRSGHV